ncbi:DHA2 family efflux MFS transporter permease subunit [Streptomyces sp. NPDC088747]|uniref:DHA2 family efflux MFS transporter permease subunit n=1 Tax=Streptomyces sp. NPDC088747 TaxID=3365886 RepID=UPI00380C3DA3
MHPTRRPDPPPENEPLPGGRAAARRATTQRTVVTAVFVSATFLSVMDGSIVNVALPSIARDLDVAPTAVSATTTVYLVTLAVIIPTAGWVGDRFGQRRVMLLAIATFGLGSLLCAVAQDFPQLALARVLQGIGGGMMMPTGTTLLYRTFPPDQRARLARILLLPPSVAAAVGPLFGGALVTHVSWRWIFLINVPVCAAVVLYGGLFLRGPATKEEAGSFDAVGLLLAATGFAALVHGVGRGPQQGWTDPMTLATLVSGVVLVGILIVHQLHRREPALRLTLYRNSLFRLGSSLVFLYTAVLQGVLLTIALLVQEGLGGSAWTSGLATLPQAVGVVVGAQVASRWLYQRLGPGPLAAIGLSGVAASCVAAAFVRTPGQLWLLQGAMFATGYFVAHVMVATQAATVAQIEHADLSRASALFISSRQLGGAAGIAFASTLIATATPSHDGLRPALGGYHTAFLGAAALALLGTALALRINNRDAAATFEPGTAP